MKIPVFEVICCFLLVPALPAEIHAQESPSHSLRVGTKEAPPFAMKTAEGEWVGLSIELWRQIADELDLTFEFQERSLQELIDHIAEGSLDAAVAALTITPEREKRVDFTHAFYTTGLGIAVAAKAQNPWWTVASRFFSMAFLKVVATLTLLLLAVGVLIWWVERRQNPEQFSAGPGKGIGAGFWWSAVTMTTVGYGDKAPVTIAGRILGLIWMFAAIIIISSFTAAITSSLTVSRLESVVENPEDLARVTVGTIADTTSESYLTQNRISHRSFASAQEGLAALEKGDIQALVHDAPILRYFVHENHLGSLKVLPFRLQRQDYGIALPPRSALRERINVVLLQKIRERDWQNRLNRYLGE